MLCFKQPHSNFDAFQMIIKQKNNWENHSSGVSIQIQFIQTNVCGKIVTFLKTV